MNERNYHGYLLYLGRKRKIDDREGTSKLVSDVYRERQASKVQRSNDGGMREGFRK